MSANEEYILGADPTAPDGFAAMPLGRVHMVGGASGAGKTTLLFQMIKASQHGEEFMGYPTQWHPSVYVAFDRRVDETEETMRRVGLDPTTLPHYFWEVPLCDPNKLVDTRLEEIVRDIRNKHPEVRIIYFDAFYILAAHGQMNNYQIMAHWLQRAGTICEKNNLTLIGIVHSAKQRKGAEILDPRYSITGSVATGGFTSCQVIVEKPDVNDQDKRIVHVYPRNTKENSFEMVVDEKGLLQTDAETDDARIYVLEKLIIKDLKGKAISLKAICAHMKKSMKCSQSATQRYLLHLLAQDKIFKPARGYYAAVPPKVTQGSAS